MKRILQLIACSSLLLCLAVSVKAETLGNDTLIQVKSFRPVQMSLAFDWGWSSARQTYLAPLLYNGTSYSIHFERSREMRWNRWENHQLLDVDYAIGRAEHGENSEMWSGRAMYRYAMHYELIKGSKPALGCRNFDLFVGPYLGAEAGFDYNLKLVSGNNPATVRAVVNAGVSLLARKGFTWSGKPCQIDLLAQMPLVGMGLMPEYGSSYYEAFYLKTDQSKLHFTSLHNQQDVDVRLGLNIPVAVIPCFRKYKPVIRLGGFYHIDTMKLNDIVSRYSSVGFTIGWTWKYLPL